MKAFLISVVCCSLLAACSKNRSSNELVGKWKLVETSRIGQAWEPATAMQEVTLTFRSNGTYSMIPHPVSSFSGCTGNYRITAGNTLMMTSSCQANPTFEEELGYSRDGDVLILDHRTTSSGVKSKYVKE